MAARILARARRGGALLAALGTLSLGACLGGGGGVTSAPPAAPAPVAEAPPPAGPAPTVGTGSVKVALILPLTGQGSVPGNALRNGAELALAEFQGSDLQLLVKDDRGTADGAREAADQAVAEGAELIVGPLFAPSVQAAGQVARQAGRPMIAFSTDASVGSRGVYLLSFLPQTEVDRIVDHAAGQGRRSFAAMIPETVYGNVVEAQFREAAARKGLRVVALERYPAGKPEAAVARLAPLVTGAAPQADALFLPETAEGLAGAGQALTQAGFNPQRVKPIGTGFWNDPRATRVAAIQGGWYAAPDSTGFNGFAERYRAKFNADPTRLASLSYDAVSLAAALSRTQGSQRFSEGVLTNPSGARGVDGVFRLRPDGTNDRSLAVFEIRSGAATVVSPAPQTLGGPNI